MNFTRACVQRERTWSVGHGKVDMLVFANQPCTKNRAPGLPLTISPWGVDEKTPTCSQHHVFHGRRARPPFTPPPDVANTTTTPTSMSDRGRKFFFGLSWRGWSVGSGQSRKFQSLFQNALFDGLLVFIPAPTTSTWVRWIDIFCAHIHALKARSGTNYSQ